MGLITGVALRVLSLIAKSMCLFEVEAGEGARPLACERALSDLLPPVPVPLKLASSLGAFLGQPPGKLSSSGKDSCLLCSYMHAFPLLTTPYSSSSSSITFSCSSFRPSPALMSFLPSSCWVSVNHVFC